MIGGRSVEAEPKMASSGLIRGVAGAARGQCRLTFPLAKAACPSQALGPQAHLPLSTHDVSQPTAPREGEGRLLAAS